jgi:competence protein ComEA
VDSVTPPWRVFDAPARADDAGVRTGDVFSGAGTRPESSAAPGTRGIPSLAVVAGILIALFGFVAALVLAVSGTGGSVDVDGGVGITVESGAATSPPGGDRVLVVDVAGAVAHPGVYRLSPGSRVADAIAAAGGYSPRVAAGLAGRTLNLAAPLQDGQLIVVPSRDDAASASSGSGGGSGGAGSGGASSPIDLNRATADQLDALPGIGPVTANKILASRADAPFHAVDDLLTRKLVGQKVFDQIKSLVTVG